MIKLGLNTMNNKFFTIQEVIEIIKNYPYAMIAIDRCGNIKNCIGLEDLPKSADDADRIMKTETNKGCLINMLKQDKDITESKIKAKIKEAVEGHVYCDTHGLKQGVNIPRKEES